MDNLNGNRVNKIEIILWITGFITAVVNVIFLRHEEFSIFCVLIEIALLMLAFFRRNMALYLSLYTIFLSLCLEFDVFVGTSDFYNIKNIRVMGLNVGIWMLIPIWMTCLTRPVSIKEIKSRYPAVWKVAIYFLAMNALAAFMGILMILMDDNHITLIGNIMNVYMRNAYSYLLLPASLYLGGCIVLIYENDRMFMIECTLKAALFMSVVQLLCSYLVGVTGNSYVYDTLLSSVITIFVPFLILFTQYNKGIVQKTLIILTSFLGCYFCIRYNASGKMLITLFICLMLFFIMGKKSYKKKFILSIAIIVIGAGMVTVIITSSYINGNLSIKLNQTVGLIKFWREDWLDIMGMSPRIRMEEMRDVVAEYAHKPLFVLTGKGYCGSVKDYGGYIQSIPEIARGGTFSDPEYRNNSFYNLHEFTKPAIVFGIVGFIFAWRLIRMAIMQIRTNLWLLIGTYWYLLFYGYSFTIGVIGILCLFVGLVRSPGNKNIYAEEYKLNG